jgi:hypothetical protein
MLQQLLSSDVREQSEHVHCLAATNKVCLAGVIDTGELCFTGVVALFF